MGGIDLESKMQACAYEDTIVEIDLLDTSSGLFKRQTMGLLIQILHLAGFVTLGLRLKQEFGPGHYRVLQIAMQPGIANRYCQ